MSGGPWQLLSRYFVANRAMLTQLATDLSMNATNLAVLVGAERGNLGPDGMKSHEQSWVVFDATYVK